jgi:hypothetical protein
MPATLLATEAIRSTSTDNTGIVIPYRVSERKLSPNDFHGCARFPNCRPRYLVFRVAVHYVAII